ncbi:phage minor head protein, partial [Streptomyces sp. NPDC049879]|uniref:phage minor head protein n=1 Tax=Streptomyces sp. NPDC049879 TaxID=3365598 RepID=UPI00379A6963
MPPSSPTPIEGEDELAAAVRDAMRAYLDEVLAVVVDDKPPADTLTAAVDLRRWPDDSVWTRAVDRFVRPVVDRLYRRAYERNAGQAPSDARAQGWVGALVQRMAPQTWPRRVWAAVQQAVIASHAAQEPPDLLDARVRDVLRVDAPGAEYRERTAQLRRVAADDQAPDDARAAARAELDGRDGPPPDGAGRPWESDAGRIAASEAVAAAGGAAVEAAQDGDDEGVMKRWVSRHDDRVRAAHLAADGQTVPVGEPFVVDLESLMYPGDPSGSPENSINCRCEVRIVPAATVAAGAPEETQAMTTTTEAITAAVTARTDLPFAPRDTAWDGQAAREAVRTWATSDGKLDPAKYADAFLYRPAGAPPSAFQLPFATIVDGKLTAVWKGVAAAAAAVQGGRGGVELPADAVEQVKARLTTLYAKAAKDFDDDTITPPWKDKPAMRASLVAAAALEAPAPTFDGAIDVWGDAEAGRPPADWFVKPDWLDGPGTLPVPDDVATAEPIDGAKPRITVYPDGRILGYTASWTSCHIGFADECVPPPPDTPTGPGQLGYENFHRPPVRIADGALRLGKVTMVTEPKRPGHAFTNLNAASAVAHYDNVGTLAALVRAGEDEHGIWIAGAVMPDLTAADRAKLALSELSGDWRTVNGVPLQMIASLAVNHGGFIASAAGDQAPAARTEAGGCGCNAGAADQAVVEEAQAVVDAAA